MNSIVPKIVLVWFVPFVFLDILLDMGHRNNRKPKERRVILVKGDLETPFKFQLMQGNGLETLKLAQRKHDSFKDLSFF